MEEENVFEVTYTVYARVKINKKVIDQVDENWRNDFYNFKTDDEIIEHVSTNLIKGWNLSQLDGFANLQDDDAKLIEVDYIKEDIEKI